MMRITIFVSVDMTLLPMVVGLTLYLSYCYLSFRKITLGKYAFLYLANV